MSKRGETRTLAAFTLLMTAFAFLQLMVDLKSALMLYLPYVIFPATFMQGVIIDLYTRKTLQKPGYSKLQWSLLALPVLVAFVAQVAMVSRFPEFRDVEAVYHQKGRVNTYTAVLFISTLSYGLIFLWASASRVYAASKAAEAGQKMIPGARYGWLMLFVLFNSVLSLAGLANVSYNLIGATPAPVNPMTAVLLSGGNFLILTFLIRQPAIFAMTADQEIRTSNSKYAKIQNLDENTRTEYLSRIRQYLTHQEPYLDDSFSLNDLSERLGIAPHLISMVINAELQQNFYTLINSYRVEKAKQLLLAEKQPNMLEVAYASGFQSKSAFNRVFKQFTCQTPSAYRNS